MRVLVANRGEIAVRVIRSCRELGHESVAIYSTADADSLHVRLADRAVCIGPPPAAQSYLAQPAIVSAALGVGADAVHPGYGFLAENAEFCGLCERNGLVFVGPRAEAIRLMGDKACARAVAAELGVPVVPGPAGTLSSPAEAERLADALGYPVLLKAVAGGGGRGMRLIESPAAVGAAFREATAEATAAFGDGALYLERKLNHVRHIEVQVMADGAGKVIHLGERDCSVQRRRQKLCEEAPAPVLSARTRREMTDSALQICRHIGYAGAGTVEFVVDPAADAYFFIEMNTRIQVEHPVTEMLTGVDIVALQLGVAAQRGLAIESFEPAIGGHAIECRINAEDPAQGFQPTPGKLTAFLPPGGPGIRVDSHCYHGYTVPPFYDSMIAKVIAVAADRPTAIRRMRRALSEFTIEGVKTTIPFHLRLLADEEFQRGDISTTWVEERFLPRYKRAVGA